MNLQNLMVELDLKKFGWSRAVGEKGEIAFFPNTAKSDSEWESRCVEMHQAQRPLFLAKKPSENNLENKKLARAD